MEDITKQSAYDWLGIDQW